MAGRVFPWPALALLLALVAPRAAGAVDILRLKPQTDGTVPLSLFADQTYQWTENGEDVYVLGGSIWIEQDHTQVSAPRAVVWIDARALKKREPARVVIYAAQHEKNKVRVKTRGQPEQEAEAVVLEFSTASLARLRGWVNEQSMANTGLYARARAARGLPLVATGSATVGDSPVQPAIALQPDPLAPSTPGAGTSPPPVAGTTVLPVPLVETRTLLLSPRTNRPFTVTPVETGKKNEKASIVTGGVKLEAKFTTGALQSISMEADRIVIWKKDADATKDVDQMSSPEGSQGDNGAEVFLEGNVVIRFANRGDVGAGGGLTQARTVRADRVYYDIDKHKAIATNADVEYLKQGYVNTGHLTSPEILQLSSTEFSAFDAVLSASRLPSDPGFSVRMDRVQVYQEPESLKRTIFGTPFRKRDSGEQVESKPEIMEAEDLTTELLGQPIWYWPFWKADINDPFGPFKGVTFRQDRQFGFQTYANWDMLKLIGLTPLKNERWDLLTDYMTRRGPALGTNYTRIDDKLFGMDAPFQTLIKGYMVNDAGTDILGGTRENEYSPTHLRGRFLFRHLQEYEDFSLQAQVAYLTDHNFLEQYYKFEFDSGANQETFIWGKYQRGNAAATLLVESPLARTWVNETYWLPRVDGYLLGQSLFDRFTYHTWGNAAFAQLQTWTPPIVNYPPPVQFPQAYYVPPPEKGVSTGRFDWMQELSMPFDLGPAKVVPYGVLDLAYYTQNNFGEGQSRLYGGGGIRASMPLSKLYRDVESELFNLNGLYHKNLFSLNYYVAGSTAAWVNMPQLDRLNDDSTQQAWQDIIPWEPTFPQLLPGGKGYALAFGSYERFNPRMYAIRRLVDSKPDTLDDIQELQLDWRQRFQTKRGYPGLEHTVDWLTVDLSASVFPVANRDNYGSLFGFLEGHMIWNVGDRNGLFANAWVDPFKFGTRYWEIGTFFYRDDRTSIALAYKHVDPLQSRLFSASLTYVFGPKYAVTAITAYDFGYKASLTNSLYVTRVGTDMAISAGFTYNSLINNAGLTLNVVPNLIASQSSPVPYRYGGGSAGGSNPGDQNGGLGGRGGGSDR
ncbi:MAG TPA: hypothetical protein VHR66_05460 [Gemmataceae bacterium]|nr:hypothetical protein [Gemmataceae bacterium]